MSEINPKQTFNVPHYRRALILRAPGYMRLLERYSTINFQW